MAHFHAIVHAVVPAHGFLLIAGVVPEQLQDVKTRRAEAMGPAAVVRTGGKNDTFKVTLTAKVREFPRN